jgi:uncharacterized protein YjcR
MKKQTLLEQLKAELVGEAPPEGWYSVADLMEKLGVKRTVVDNLVRRKEWKVEKFKAKSRDGKALKVNHYYVGKL